MDGPPESKSGSLERFGGSVSPPRSTLLFCIPCASVEEYIVAALATKPHRQMAATSANTVGMASFASRMEYLLLSIRHPSRQKEQVNAVTEGYCVQVGARSGLRSKCDLGAAFSPAAASPSGRRR